MPPRTPARQSRPDASDLAKTAPGLAGDPPNGQPVAGVLSFNGETYKLDAKQGVWPLLQFARVAEAGMNTTDMRGLAAVHAFLQDVIDPGDWGRFQEDMIAKKVTDIKGLLDTTQQAVNHMLERMEAADGEPGG